MSVENFTADIANGYTFKGDSIIMGTAILNGQPVPNAHVKIALKSLNRHGLIAGATGTGKTKTLQVFAEELSEKGIPCLLMDLKGDLSGLAKAGSLNTHIEWRHGQIGVPYDPKAMPVELMSISGEKGVKLKATVSEFGPVLISKILELNTTQSGILAIIFKYCDDHDLPLLNIDDLKKALMFSIEEGKDVFTAEYGTMSSMSVGTILRKVVELEQQGAATFFGELSFEVSDLLRTSSDGKGILNIIRLTDIQDKPKLFSTFMLSLLAEVYHEFPEQGDADKPKLCIFIDEAHLVFNNASKPLLDQIESIIKLIRSKGVGIYFITQNPTDVPEAVLSQLGLKIQHALRAFTANDRKAIQKTAQNYPDSAYYKTDEVLTSLGIGEALITGLNEKGIPTPLAATLLRAPKTRMDILSESEISDLVNQSKLVAKYDKEIDTESAQELLTKKIEKIKAQQAEELEEKAEEKIKRTTTKKETSFIESASKNTFVRQLGRTVLRELTRGLLGKWGK